MTTTGNEAAPAQYLPLLWPVQRLGAAIKHNDVYINKLNDVTLLQFYSFAYFFLGPLDSDGHAVSLMSVYAMSIALVG